MTDRPESPIDRLLPLLSVAQQTGERTWRARCPAHQDRNPSLDVKVGDDDIVLLQCRSQRCTAEAICVAVGLTLSDLFPTGSHRGNGPAGGNGRPTPSKPRRLYATINELIEALRRSSDLTGGVVTRHEYTDFFSVIRFDFDDGRKSFRPIHRVVNKWAVGDPDVPLPLYRIKEATKHDPIYIAEGEKPCDAAWAIGIPCVTSAHGSQSPQRSDWSPLAKKNIVILPDYDEPGQKYAEKVSELVRIMHALHLSNCTVKTVRLPDLPARGDIVDFIEARDSCEPEQLLEMIQSLASNTTAWKPRTVIRIGDHLTELSMAERLVRDHQDDLRYCKAYGYLTWDRKRWRVDDTGEVKRRIKKVIRGLYVEASRIEDPVVLKALIDFAKRCETLAKIHAIGVLAQSELPIPIRVEHLDRDPWLFNVANGTIDLKTGQLKPHDRNDLLSKLSPVTYDPNAKCPLFDRFLRDILPGESLRLFAQRAIGYALAGLIRQHVLHLLWGTGANGKSTFINAILSILGDYGMMAAPKLLMARKHEQHPTELADLFGKRFIASLETGEGHRFDEELVKRLTGGDRIKARLMRRDFFEFAPSHKLFLATNHRPNIRGTDDGIWRRVRLWPFAVAIPKSDQDEELGEKLLAERSGVLAWAVRGCLEWQAGGLTEPDEVTTATATFREDCDVLGGFIAAYCVTESGCTVASCDLYAAYKSWADETGEHPVSLTRFGRAIQERGYQKNISGPARRMHYFGLGLREEREGQRGFSV